MFRQNSKTYLPNKDGLKRPWKLYFIHYQLLVVKHSGFIALLWHCFRASYNTHIFDQSFKEI